MYEEGFIKPISQRCSAAIVVCSGTETTGRTVMVYCCPVDLESCSCSAVAKTTMAERISSGVRCWVMSG